MTYTPTSETLELAALACGKEVTKSSEPYLTIRTQLGGETCWNPFMPTTQGKADLLDLMLAIPLDLLWRDDILIVVDDKNGSFEQIEITNGNKHAALAQAAITVAAMVGEKMKEKV